MKHITVKSIGPLFNPSVVETAISTWETETTKLISEAGVNTVRSNFSTQVQHPSGYYSSHITNTQIDKERFTINDSNVIYGSWLEGTSSRNQTTRFKGYASFRKAMQSLQEQSATISQPTIEQLVKELS